MGAGGQSWESSALYCSVRPAEEMFFCFFLVKENDTSNTKSESKETIYRNK